MTEKLIFVYILLLPLQTVFIFDEKFINGAKWQFGTGAIYGTELIFWLIAFLFVFQSLKKANSEKIRTRLKTLIWSEQKYPLIFLWLFIAWTAASIIWAPEKSAAFYLWFKLAEGAALFLMANAINAKKENLAWPWSIAGGISGLTAFWQFISQSVLANKWLGTSLHQAGRLGDIVIETADGRWLRAYGTFSHPNILGGFCAFGLLATLSLAFEKQKKNDALLLAMIIANSLGLFFSFSRAAWLAAAIGVILMFAHGIKGQSRNWAKFAIAIGATFFSLSLIFFPLLAARSDLSNRLEQKSITERTGQLNDGWRAIKGRPLQGTGLNNYTYFQSESDPSLSGYELQPIHDIYLLIAAELGIIGLILLLLFVATLAGGAKISLASWAWLATGATIGFFDHYLWTQYSGIIIFWLVLTIFYKSCNVKR